MPAFHRVLVVEDDVPTREELTELLRSLHFEVTGCGDKQTALRCLDEQTFCMALVDLQIFGDPASTRPMEIHGHTLVREIRTKYPERHGPLDWRFPVVVVSAYAREATASKDVIREGASDIVWKLSAGFANELRRTIEEQLRASGREDHADCHARPLELSIPGDRVKRRTTITLGGRSASLTDAQLRVLLHLIKGKLKGTRVHNQDMGFTGVGGNRLPSELNAEMSGTFPAGITEIVESHYYGNYSLIDAVTIGEIAYDRLVAMDDSAIAALTHEIEQLRSEPQGNS